MMLFFCGCLGSLLTWQDALAVWEGLLERGRSKLRCVMRTPTQGAVCHPGVGVLSSRVVVEIECAHELQGELKLGIMSRGHRGPGYKPAR